MTRVLAILAVLALSGGCRERYPETEGLRKARASKNKSTKSGGMKRRTEKAPAGFDKLLTGGKQVFSDDFDREGFGTDWKAESKGWTLEDGAVRNDHADNMGLWLLHPLPSGAVRIEFDARSDTFQKKGKTVFPGDLKCEAFNMRPEHQTGYVFIFGGWTNRVNRIARLEEHGDGDGARVVDGPKHEVEAGHTYRMKVIRSGNVVAWYADDTYLAHMTDSDFIEGRHFGFNNWRSRLTFDNLAIYSLDSP